MFASEGQGTNNKQSFFVFYSTNYNSFVFSDFLQLAVCSSHHFELESHQR